MHVYVMLPLEIFHLANGNQPARSPAPDSARRSTHGRAGIDPRQKWARVCLPTACADSPAQLRPCVGGSNIQSLTPNLQNLIANGILELPLTDSKQTTGTASNREKFRGPRTKKRRWGVTFETEANKRLIATHANSEINLTNSKHSTLHFSNRNKKHHFAAAPLARFTDHGSGFTRHRSRATSSRFGATRARANRMLALRFHTGAGSLFTDHESQLPGARCMRPSRIRGTQFRRDTGTPITNHSSLLTAFLIGNKVTIEIAVTYSKQRRATNSNR